VAAVDEKWNFVIIRMSDDFAKTAVPNIDLNLRRSTDAAKYVTKVRLTSVKRDQKLAVADILLSWKMAAVQPGDVAFY
jgi:hypothetical protein